MMKTIGMSTIRMNWFIIIAAIAFAMGAVQSGMQGEYKVALLGVLYSCANMVIATIGE